MPSQPETVETEVQMLALQLMSNLRQHDYKFVSSLELTFSELPTLHEGQIMVVQNGIGVDGGRTAALAEYLSAQFGISCAVAATSWEHCKAQLQSAQSPEGHWFPCAPWFMHWYANLDIVEPTIREFVRSLLANEVSSNGVLLYRGESRRFPSVRSTLSRYWDTTDPNALKIMQERGEQDIRSRGLTGNEGDLRGTLQHLGGKTNTVDFSGNPWVALFFACESNPGEDGVIWGYNRARPADGITVRRLDPQNEVAKNRTERQVGWVLEPDNGMVPGDLLLRVATVPKELKPKLLEFLQQAGVEEKTLFPDIHKVAQDGQQTIPLEALVSMFAEHLQKGDVAWVLQNAGQLLNSDNEDATRRRTCLYFRGLASALSGNLTQARQDLLESLRLFGPTETAPKVLQKNLSVIQAALRSRDVSRIKKNLDYDVSDSGWWSFALSEYTFLGQY